MLHRFKCFRRLFVKCSTTAREAAAKDDIETAMSALDIRLLEVEAKIADLERNLIKENVRIEAVRQCISGDPNPDILRGRLLKLHKEKGFLERNIRQMVNIANAIKKEQYSLQQTATNAGIPHIQGRVVVCCSRCTTWSTPQLENPLSAQRAL